MPAALAQGTWGWRPPARGGSVGSGAGGTRQRVGEGGSGAARGGLSRLRGGLVSQRFPVSCGLCAVSWGEGDLGSRGPAHLGRWWWQSTGGRLAWPVQAGHMPCFPGSQGNCSVCTLHPPSAHAAASRCTLCPPQSARCIPPAHELGQRWELVGLQAPLGGDRVPHPSPARRAPLHQRVLGCHFGKAGEG